MMLEFCENLFSKVFWAQVPLKSIRHFYHELLLILNFSLAKYWVDQFSFHLVMYELPNAVEVSLLIVSLLVNLLPELPFQLRVKSLVNIIFGVEPLDILIVVFDDKIIRNLSH